MHPNNLVYIKKFFDEIDFVQSREFKESPKVNEIILTFLLGKLLSSNSEFHKKMLSCPISKLNYYLNRYGGNIDIKFQINEQGSEEENTKADLGIIVNINGKTKGILVQSKRLYLNSNDKFVLQSSYNAFECDQFKTILEKEEEFKKKEYKTGYCYFLYNPILSSFNTDWQKIASLEINSGKYSLKDLNSITKRPGLRVVDTDFIKSLLTKKKSFNLKDCYDQSSRPSPPGKISFITFSSFILELFKCNVGSTNKKLIELCYGPKLDSDDNSFAAKSTLIIDAEFKDFNNPISKFKL